MSTNPANLQQSKGLSELWRRLRFVFLAIILAAVNIFGGFLETQRKLAMYKKKKKDK